jgi:hypothetical protein
MQYSGSALLTQAAGLRGNNITTNHLSLCHTIPAGLLKSGAFAA